MPINNMGFIFIVLSKISAIRKMAIAAQSVIAALISVKEDVLKRLNSNMVAAADIISPKDVDFRPFKTSRTHAELLYL